MITIILIIFAGITVGYMLHGKDLSIISKVLSITIVLLLFFLGVSVGNNSQIMGNLHTISLDAFIITLAALLVSCIVYHVFLKLYRYL